MGVRRSREPRGLAGATALVLRNVYGKPRDTISHDGSMDLVHLPTNLSQTSTIHAIRQIYDPMDFTNLNNALSIGHSSKLVFRSVHPP